MIVAHSSKRPLIKLVALGRGFGSSLDDDERESVQRVEGMGHYGVNDYDMEWNDHVLYGMGGKI